MEHLSIRRQGFSGEVAINF